MTKEEFEKTLSLKTFYLTKNALSRGIQTVSNLCRVEGNVLVSYRQITIFPFGGCYEYKYIPFLWRTKPDWHETREEAVKRAEEIRTKAIAACERKLSKLKQLKF